MEISLSTWSVPWAIGLPGYPAPAAPLDPVGLMDRATELGIKVVQFADNLPLDTLPESQLAQIAAHATQSGLLLELGVRGLDPGHLRRYLDIASRVDARVVRTVLSGSMCTREQLVHTEQQLRMVLPELEQREIALALENNEAFSAAEFAEIVRAVNSPLVGICLDTANSLGRPETFRDVVNELADQTIMLHAKDYEIQRIDTRMGFTIEGRALGQGRVDFEWVLSRLRDSGRDAITVVIEHWPPFDGDIEATIRHEEQWLSTSLAHLRSLL